MQKFRPVLVVALLSTAGLVPSVLGWGNDPMSEPSSPTYDLPKYIWHFPNDEARRLADGGTLKERIYFNAELDTSDLVGPNADFAGAGAGELNGRLAPAGQARARAFLGYWRDCNGDGYIGDRLTGLLEYPLNLATVNVNVCPPGSAYNPGTAVGGLAGLATGPMIHEFRSIGKIKTGSATPWSIDDQQARVWGDLRRPDQVRAETAPLTPLPQGTLDSWNGHIRYVDAIVGASALYAAARDSAGNPDALPGDLYATPLATLPTPLKNVKDLYGQESTSNPEGKPLVRVWHCEDATSGPALAPGVDPSGSVGDSINNTVKGLVAPNSPVAIGQGCDGTGNGGLFPDGVSLSQVFQIEAGEPGAQPGKHQTDFYFTYTPPTVAAVGSTGQLMPTYPLRTFAGGLWFGAPGFVGTLPGRAATYYTFYAKVDVAGKDATEFPYAQLDPTTKVSFKYGEEACTSGPAFNGWDCSAWPNPSAAWKAAFAAEGATAVDWMVMLGESYQFRDIDCTDLTPAAPGTLNPLKQDVDAIYAENVPPLLDPWPGPATVFGTYCA